MQRNPQLSRLAFLKMTDQLFGKCLSCFPGLDSGHEIMHFRREYRQSEAVLFSFHPIRWYTILIGSIIGEVNFDHLLTDVSTTFSPVQLFFLFATNKYYSRVC